MGKLRRLSDLEQGFEVDRDGKYICGSKFGYWRECRGLPCDWDLVQNDMEVWSILESIGIPKDAYRYLLVAIGEGDYLEIWGADSVYGNSIAEQIFWMGKVTWTRG